MQRLIAVLITLFLPLSAAALSAGDALPTLSIEDKGELFLTQQNEVGYRAWSSEALDTQSEVQILQYMAARPSAEKQIRPFTDRLEAMAYPEELLHVTTVVNLDDVTFGMTGFAESELEKNKKEYPTSGMVADLDGKGLGVWGFKPKSSALIILRADGKILFVKDGKLNQQEIDQALALIGSEVAKRQ